MRYFSRWDPVLFTPVAVHALVHAHHTVSMVCDEGNGRGENL
jgi:hypothetical protein